MDLDFEVKYVSCYDAADGIGYYVHPTDPKPEHIAHFHDRLIIERRRKLSTLRARGAGQVFSHIWRVDHQGEISARCMQRHLEECAERAERAEARRKLKRARKNATDKVRRTERSYEDIARSEDRELTEGERAVISVERAQAQKVVKEAPAKAGRIVTLSPAELETLTATVNDPRARAMARARYSR